MSAGDDISFLPPPQPPSLLSPAQLHNLSTQGHLPIELPANLHSICSSLSAAAAAFFEQDTAVKSQAYPAAYGTEAGYYCVDGVKEYITLRHSSCTQAASKLQQLAREVWRGIAGLLHRVLSDLSRELGIPDHAWHSLLEGCFDIPESNGVDVMLPTMLRLFQYAPNEGVAGNHTDNGLLTLCVGNGRGLQVWEKDQDGNNGHWLDAQGPTVLIGDTLRIFSDYRLSVGRHRVVANESGRSSIVFALRPCLRHEVDLRPFGGGDELISVKELYDLINSKKFNINSKQVKEVNKPHEVGEQKPSQQAQTSYG